MLYDPRLKAGMESYEVIPLLPAIARDAGLDEIKQIMNTDQFTLEEEDDSGYLVNAIDDDTKQTKTNETDSAVETEVIDTNATSITETSVNKNDA